MPIRSDRIVLGSKKVITISEAVLLLVVREGVMIRETFGCWQGPFPALVSSCKEFI